MGLSQVKLKVFVLAYAKGCREYYASIIIVVYTCKSVIEAQQAQRLIGQEKQLAIFQSELNAVKLS